MTRAPLAVAVGFCALLAALLGGATREAHAHTRSVSYSSWKLDEQGASVKVRIPLLQLSRLAFDPVFDTATGGPAAAYLADHLVLRAGDARCEPTAPPEAQPAPAGWAHFRWRVVCAASGPRSVETAVLLAEAPSHLHFARVAGDGIEAHERVLTEAEPRWSFESPDAGPGAGSGSGTTLGGYITLGAEHIATGWDHLAFVLALLLLAGSVREVAGLVTAFTVAHSVTLGLAVLGWVRPEGAAVEALIGYSIALVAAENAWLLGGRGRAVPWLATGGTAFLAVLALFGIGSVGPVVLAGLAVFVACHFGLLERVERPARLRAAVAFAFGLVHGFGFAGVLAEMALPTGRLVPALFGFNAGVEIGQLAIVLVVWPALAWLARTSRERWLPLVAEGGSAAICGLGVFWFLGRLFG